MIVFTTSPQPSISISCNALLSAFSAFTGLRPFSKRELASVRSPIFLAVRLTDTPSKQAASNTTVVVSSIIPLCSPPITPAMAIGFFPSAIISISGVSFTGSAISSSSFNVSPSFAFLTTILLSSTYLKSNACIG